MVGYVMVIYDFDIPEYDIWHMMIDKSEQGRGYGSEAFDRVIDYIGTKPFGDSDRVALTCNKDNTAAIRLYEKNMFLRNRCRGRGRDRARSYSRATVMV